jgi:hypothetical protein
VFNKEDRDIYVHVQGEGMFVFFFLEQKEKKQSKIIK